MRLCFEVSGEHRTLPAAEISAAVEAASGRKPGLASEGDAIFLNAPSARAAELCERLALTKYVSAVLAAGRNLKDIAKDENLSKIAGERARVRARIVSGDWTDEDREEAERKIGAVLAAKNRIDLCNPVVEVRVILGERVHLCRLLHATDRAGFEARKGENRPFFSPISLHPKYARALVNLSRVRRGGTLLDPFCGTGGILIEGALAGARVLGSDVDRRMLEGSRWNLAHFGLRASKLEDADVSAISEFFGKVDAIATDPPYGRASYTARERPAELHARMLTAFEKALKPGGHAAVILPDLKVLEKLPSGLSVVESHASRVHRSLTRHFVVLKRV